jgi:hypothetical protein
MLGIHAPGITAPDLNIEKILLILKRECEIRTSPEFLEETKKHLEKNLSFPEQVHS